jgi:uncharacterized protein DUF6875
MCSKMSDAVSAFRPESDLQANDLGPALIGWAEAETLAAQGGAMGTFFEWLKAYPMNPHAELGRPGVVCPFTKQAKKIGSIRMAMFATRAEDEAAAYAIIRQAFLEMDRIPVERGSEEFRTVVLAFPECDSEAGLAMLKRVIKRLKYFALFGFRTVGFMHKDSEETGLWNPNFRPLRAPMPVLALRYVVEHDAPFIARYHLMWGPYLMRYGLDGAKRLFGERVRRSARTASG